MTIQSHLDEQLEAFAKSAIVLAQSAKIPLWMAREQLIQAYDKAAQAADEVA